MQVTETTAKKLKKTKFPTVNITNQILELVASQLALWNSENFNYLFQVSIIQDERCVVVKAV